MFFGKILEVIFFYMKNIAIIKFGSVTWDHKFIATGHPEYVIFG